MESLGILLLENFQFVPISKNDSKENKVLHA